MTAEEMQKIGEKLLEMYGDSLPDPIHEPMQFAYVLKLFMYYNHGENNEHS